MKPCILSADRQVLVPQTPQKVEREPFSNKTVQRRIEDKAFDVEE